MSEFAYDPEDWLVSTFRQLGAYVAAKLIANPALGDAIEVEMSFPDTTRWTKEQPLEKTIVHFELDDQEDPPLGFGIPGVSTYTYDEEEEVGSVSFSEAAWHLLHFDVGIWASAQSGGVTKRLQVRQALKDIFATAGGQQAFNEATEGLWPISFHGGRDLLDRVNDLPVWRTADMALVIRVFSKHTDAEPVTAPGTFEQEQGLTIIGNDGQPKPV